MSTQLRSAAHPGKVVLAAIAVGLTFLALPARAQVDCSRLVPELQARCELVNRMNQACAGTTGEERRVCERANVPIPVTEDCRRVPAAARDMCEAHNDAALRAERCNGKLGADFEACRQKYALNPPLKR